MRTIIRTPIFICLFYLFTFAFSTLVFVQKTELKTFPTPTGKLVDVGGRKLHINCTGKGSPTIVMEAGAGDFSFDWSLVQPKIAKFTRVCTYDRAGYAWSEPGPTPRTMQQVVYELHSGLSMAGVKSPYVLVGHSLGGLMVRIYADQYPKEVVGMVLVDSSHEDQLIIIRDRTTKKEKIVHWREMASGRKIPPVQTTMTPAATPNTPQQTKSTNQSKLEPPYNKLPLQMQQMRRWAISQSSYDAARISETFDFLADELALMYSQRGSRTYPLGDMPLIVLTRGVAGEDEQASKQLRDDHDRLQTDLLRLSSNSKQVVAKKSGHHIQLDEPTLLVDALKQIVNALKNKKKLI